MATCKIPYGKDSITLNIPDGNIRYHGGSIAFEKTATNLEMMQRALSEPMGPGLDSITAHKAVVCLIYDASRKVPLDEFLKSAFPKLNGAATVTVLLATGTHDGDNDDNRAIVDLVRLRATETGIPLKKVLIHDCHHDATHFAGKTADLGNDIFVNPELKSAEVFLVYSDMKNHYFAGYSNALKNFFPGAGGYASVERNHALAMDPRATFGYHPLHPDLKRRDNPLALDMWQAYRLITGACPVFVVATVTMHQDVLWAKAGLLEQVIPLGIAEVDKYMSVRVRPADHMIVSCGGFPNDESLYMAQRALELSQAGVKEGGEILFLAECANGIGPQKSVENFYTPLTRPVPQVIRQFSRAKYVMYAHKTYKFALMIRRFKAINMVSALNPEVVRAIHLKPAGDGQTVVDRWLMKDPRVTINIFSEGSKVAVHQAVT